MFKCNNKNVIDVVLVFQWRRSNVSIVDFEQANISWVVTKDEVEREISLFDTSIPQFHNGIPTKIFKDNREMF